MKRVYALYRVSTKKQIMNEGLYVQRDVCRRFAMHHKGWRIQKELEENGISGHTALASNRNAIQEFMKRANNKEFDILLVFMFDRLGRTPYEVMLIIKRLIEQGIEVWSVEEGRWLSENSFRNLRGIPF